MRNSVAIVMVISLFWGGCKNADRIVLSKGSENWSEFHAGSPSKIQMEWEAYKVGADTMIYYTNYYTNGMLKSRVVMKNDGLWQIECVFDTLGKEMNFGHLKDGNGYVVEYDCDYGNPEQEGLYVDGNKEGWWKKYHYQGKLMDSTWYEGGYGVIQSDGDILMELIDLFGPLKNNLYR